MEIKIYERGVKMIEKLVKAWDKNNELLLKEFEKENPTSYNDIVEKLVTIVINPYLKYDKDNYYRIRILLNMDL